MSSTASANDGARPSDRLDGDSKTDGPPSKRRRVALACNACRTRKSRCNGERPKCSLCSNLGFDCQYEPTDSSTNVIVKKEYVSDFETRVKSIEKMLKRHDDLLTGHLSASSARPEQSSSSPQDGHSAALNATMATSRESIQLDTSELQDLPAEETVTDGMAISFVDELNSAFFGPSSNIAFTRHILGAISSRSTTQSETFTSHVNRSGLDSGMLDYSRAPSPTFSNTPTPIHSLPSAFELPPVAETEQILQTFFQNTGLLFPFIHEPSFMEAYSKYKCYETRLKSYKTLIRDTLTLYRSFCADDFKASSFTKVRRTWLGLLNVVLAMGNNIDPNSKMNATARESKSHVFYERAANLCMKSSTRGASLDIVQYLLLASQYLQGTQKSSQTWTLHGLAVKGAFALGLHSNYASQRFSPLENEIRKRTWLGCVLLDRVLSMTFGRPPSIPEEYVRPPLAQPWPDSAQFGLRNLELQGPSMEFFNASVKLHRLIGTAIARLYGQNLGFDTTLPEAELVPRIYELERELNRWQSSLPVDLSVVQSTAVPFPNSYRDRIIARLRTMLTLRFHNLNILVHRPLLCTALDSMAKIPAKPTHKNSFSRMAEDSMNVCLASAEESINIVHNILIDPSLGATVLGAWWFTLFYLFNASLVVFAKSLIQRSQVQHFQSRRLSQDIDHISRAIDAFRLLDSENRVVDRCTAYVQYLLRMLERSSQQGNELNADRTSLRHVLASQQPECAESQPPAFETVGAEGVGLSESLPDLSDFLNDDLELAQFFASGIFDMQTSADGML